MKYIQLLSYLARCLGVGPLLCPRKLLPLEFHDQLGMCGSEGPLVFDPRLPALSEDEYLKGESLALSLPASLQPPYRDENHANETGCDYVIYIVLRLGLLNLHL